jgi:RNA 2',3'-cyclic 3'-phosphodiesterase
MTTIRSFIAIELSDEVRAVLTDLQNHLKAGAPAQVVRWAAPESIHLTLHFLGDVAADDVEKITELIQLAALPYPPFDLTVGGLGCFPNTRRPRIIWAGVSGQTEILLNLQRNLGEKLKAIGVTPEARPYAPHLTVGRVKVGLPQRQLTQLGQMLEREQSKVGQLATLPVTEISLMKSELKPAGAVYTRLASAKLNKSVD